MRKEKTPLQLLEADYKLKLRNLKSSTDAEIRTHKKRIKALELDAKKWKFGRIKDRTLEFARNDMVFCSVVDLNMETVSKLTQLDTAIVEYVNRGIRVPVIIINPATCNEMFGCSHDSLNYAGYPLVTSRSIAKNAVMLLSVGFKFERQFSEQTKCSS